MSLFDDIQNSVFDAITNTFGDNAEWVPSNSSSAQTAKVLFKDPSETAKILDVPYSPAKSMIEYKKGDFPELKSLVDHNSEETITVNGSSYGVLQVLTKYDGKTMIAHLQILS